MKNKKYFVNLFIICFSILYAYYLYKLFWNIAFNSDSACFVLEGNDIYNGNILLSGWNLTGISFAFSDLLFYTMGIAVAGVSQKASVLAAAIPYFLLIVLSAFLVYAKRKKECKVGLLLLISVSAIPCTYLMDKARFHTASIVECLLALFLLDYFKQASKRKKRIISVFSMLLLSIAAMSDALALLMIIMPIIIVCGWRLVVCYLQERHIKAEDVYYVIISSSAMVMSFIFDKLYYLFGHANKNSFLGSRLFSKMEELPMKFEIYIKSVLGMFDANFFNTTLFSVHTLLCFLRILIVLTGLICIVYNIYLVVKGEDSDICARVLSIGVILVSFVFILTNVGIDEESARYMGTFPAIMCVIICRTDWKKQIGVKRKNAVITILSLLFIFLISCSLFANRVTEGYRLKDQEELAMVLGNSNLTHGYASFWNASSTTVLSGNKVKVRAVLNNEKGISMYNWFCKSDWYIEPSNYIITEDDDMYGVTSDNVIRVLGEPSKIIVVNKFKILVYDYNINDVVNSLGDFVIYPNEWYGNENVVFGEDKCIINQEGCLTGPYGVIKEGTYRAVCKGENLQSIEVDIYSASKGGIVREKKKMEADNSFVFSLDSITPDLEIRIYNENVDPCYLEKIVLEKIE